MHDAVGEPEHRGDHKERPREQRDASRLVGRDDHVHLGQRRQRPDEPVDESDSVEEPAQARGEEPAVSANTDGDVPSLGSWVGIIGDDQDAKRAEKLPARAPASSSWSGDRSAVPSDRGLRLCTSADGSFAAACPPSGPARYRSGASYLPGQLLRGS